MDVAPPLALTVVACEVSTAHGVVFIVPIGAPGRFPLVPIVGAGIGGADGNSRCYDSRHLDTVDPPAGSVAPPVSVVRDDASWTNSVSGDVGPGVRTYAAKPAGVGIGGEERRPYEDRNQPGPYGRVAYFHRWLL